MTVQAKGKKERYFDAAGEGTPGSTKKRALEGSSEQPAKLKKKKAKPAE